MKKEIYNVVGNAESLFINKHGKQIDENPTIRFNHLNDLDANYQGTRWDYVACSQLKLINNYGEKPDWHTLIWTRWSLKDDLKWKAISSKNNVKVIPFDTELVKSSLEKFKKRPSTGASILIYLDSIGAHCNIFGFDWKKTPSYYQTEKVESRVNTPHDYDDERNVCNYLIEKNNWNLIE